MFLKDDNKWVMKCTVLRLRTLIFAYKSMTVFRVRTITSDSKIISRTSR